MKECADGTVDKYVRSVRRKAAIVKSRGVEKARQICYKLFDVYIRDEVIFVHEESGLIAGNRQLTVHPIIAGAVELTTETGLHFEAEVEEAQIPYGDIAVATKDARSSGYPCSDD